MSAILRIGSEKMVQKENIRVNFVKYFFPFEASLQMIAELEFKGTTVIAKVKLFRIDSTL